jgi:A/G-specific DNA glycosylase
LTKLVSLQLAWFVENARDLPWRRTRDPYAIWVSEIMLQQTQVKTVIPYWERWMRELPTIESLAKARPEKIHKLWEGLGYYTRVRNMQKAAQQIVASQSAAVANVNPLHSKVAGNQSRLTSAAANGSISFPTNYEDVLALPGIGRYTAGAICSIAFNQPAPILDGNVIRVLTRLFGISEDPRANETNARLWSLAEQLVQHAKDAEGAKDGKKIRLHSSSSSPSHSLRDAPLCSFLNQSLMELGALICTPRAPQCLICPVKSLCLAFQQGRTEELPNLGKRTQITERRFAAFVCEHNGKFLVRQRPAGVVNAHLWEFPNVELLNGSNELTERAKQVLAFEPKTFEPLCRIKHSITRYRITLDAFTVNGIEIPESAFNQGEWFNIAQLQKLSFPSAHRKILNRLATRRIVPIDNPSLLSVE